MSVKAKTISEKLSLNQEEIDKGWIEHIPAFLCERDIVLAYIYLSLKRNNGNRTRTAKQLQISKRTLWARIDELRYYGVDVPISRYIKNRKNKLTDTTIKV